MKKTETSSCELFGGDILDISQPIDEQSAVFPGDIPFSRILTETYAQSAVINLSAFTMSPHVGTHADAPVHIGGDLEQESSRTAGELPLSPYLGAAWVVDVSPCSGAVTTEALSTAMRRQFGASNNSPENIPGRVLLKTREQIRYNTFEKDYAWLDPALVPFLEACRVQLVGLDTPSVDPVQSKALETHHALLKSGIFWLENLDLSRISPGLYTLIALPLKLARLEASPVRAVLIKPAV